MWVAVQTFLLREKCPNSVISEFSLNTVKYGPEKTPYLGTFQAMSFLLDLFTLEYSRVSYNNINTFIENFHIYMQKYSSSCWQAFLKICVLKKDLQYSQGNICRTDSVQLYEIETQTFQIYNSRRGITLGDQTHRIQ